MLEPMVSKCMFTLGQRVSPGHREEHHSMERDFILCFPYICVLAVPSAHATHIADPPARSVHDEAKHTRSGHERMASGR